MGAVPLLAAVAAQLLQTAIAWVAVAQGERIALAAAELRPFQGNALAAAPGEYGAAGRRLLRHFGAAHAGTGAAAEHTTGIPVSLGGHAYQLGAAVIDQVAGSKPTPPVDGMGICQVDLVGGTDLAGLLDIAGGGTGKVLGGLAHDALQFMEVVGCSRCCCKAYAHCLGQGPADIGEWSIDNVRLEVPTPVAVVKAQRVVGGQGDLIGVLIDCLC